MNVYEVEIENSENGYRLLHHLRAEDQADAIARATAHWQRPILGVSFRRKCKAWEITEQRLRDQQPKPDPSDVRIVLP